MTCDNTYHKFDSKYLSFGSILVGINVISITKLKRIIYPDVPSLIEIFLIRKPFFLLLK
jgi:hypothetical protein